MAAVTKVHGTGHTHGTQESVANLKAMELDGLVNLSGKGGLGSTIEAMVREAQPLMYVSTGTAGKIFCIVDGHSTTAADLQVRIRALGTVDSIDLSSALVVERDLDAFNAA
tara:strand:+ start:854 stop:1186 length:333 start_codon:yes stop_codon:yes gene_type:complete